MVYARMLHSLGQNLIWENARFQYVVYILLNILLSLLFIIIFISSSSVGDIDADTCRAEWNRLTQAEKDKYGYEWKLLHCLENIVKQCDKKIEKQKLRAEQDMELTEDDMRRIASLYRQIGTLIEQCEYYSDRGDIDRSMDIMKEIETLKESARKIANPPEEKKITVCEISGNFMSSR